MIWLLLTHPIAWLLYWLHPRIWVKLDVKRFTEDGSKNSLLRTFHRQRATWRAIVTIVVAVAASLPTWGYWLPFGLSLIGLLALAAAYWTFDFNPRLNVARKLPYVGEWHVSWNPNGAFFPDRYIWTRAWQKVRGPRDSSYPPEFEDLRVVAVAGPMLRQLLHNILVNGITFYCLTLAGIAWWEYAQV
ncbi:hypothetical protein [Hymenobacter sp. YC55]|uniref:hypothetical protein n=1 Tax=Hymenobacter sp. YC55 TaxID=3034019 RepID=UPI0023F716EE|nr:hypothetical protein [Hymenobacter sp. YC55]MDF7810681.1 hypothetical protein [Hymenobacter sp. YC55]